MQIAVSRNGFAQRGFHRPFRRGEFWGGYSPYFYDGDDPYNLQPTEPSEPEPSATLAPATPEHLPEPVLLELHGDQWVKVESLATVPRSASEPVVQQAEQRTETPAILVFRDGHSEELNSYSIIGRFIYTKADYWSSGKWTRKIQIADLNVPATLAQNRAHGVKFQLPSSPDEVIVRP